MLFIGKDPGIVIRDGQTVTLLNDTGHTEGHDQGHVDGGQGHVDGGQGREEEGQGRVEGGLGHETGSGETVGAGVRKDVTGAERSERLRRNYLWNRVSLV